MLGKRFSITLHQTGNLSSDLSFRWIVPFSCHLDHVSAVKGNSGSGLLTISTYTLESNYTQGLIILQAKAIGPSGIPAEFSRSDYAEYRPTGQIKEREKFYVYLDRNGATITDLTIVLTFSEG